jgi:cytochrome c nitrite reductase small subunit
MGNHIASFHRDPPEDMALSRVQLWESIFVGVALGVAAGIGIFTFIYAEGASYMSDHPEACANCHVMQEQYEGWARSGHQHVAVCNDCHTPHSFIPKYYVKALNGFYHSFAFTTGDFHEPIRITERNRKVTENTCRSCHGAMVHAMEPPTQEPVSCLQCHADVGHL